VLAAAPTARQKVAISQLLPLKRAKKLAVKLLLNRPSQITAKKGGVSRVVTATAVTQEKCASRAVANGFLVKAAHKNRAVTQFPPNLLYLKQVQLLSLNRLPMLR
jgi:hypothetical protein